MDRLIRLAAKVPLANSVFERPARRRPPRPFFNVTRLTLAIAGVIPFSSFAQNANENERQHPQRRGGSKQTGTTKTHSLASNRRDLIVLENLLRSLLVMGAGLLWTGEVHAEGGSCPSGYYPVGGQGTMGCAPLPGSGNQQAPLPPAPQWERRWGAIATDGPNDALGVATDKRSKREASQIAMQDCKSKGGVSCKIDVAYDNQCAAVVVGDGGYNVGNAATVDIAVASGMKTCRDGGLTNCHAYYTACSLPVRIR